MQVKDQGCTLPKYQQYWQNATDFFTQSLATKQASKNCFYLKSRVVKNDSKNKLSHNIRCPQKKCSLFIQKQIVADNGQLLCQMQFAKLGAIFLKPAKKKLNCFSLCKIVNAGLTLRVILQ